MTKDEGIVRLNCAKKKVVDIYEHSVYNNDDEI